MNRTECPLRTPCGLCSVEKRPCDAICGALEQSQCSPARKQKPKPVLYEPMKMDVAELLYKKKCGIS